MSIPLFGKIPLIMKCVSFQLLYLRHWLFQQRKVKGRKNDSQDKRNEKKRPGIYFVTGTVTVTGTTWASFNIYCCQGIFGTNNAKMYIICCRDKDCFYFCLLGSMKFLSSWPNISQIPKSLIQGWLGWSLTHTRPAPVFRRGLFTTKRTF